MANQTMDAAPKTDRTALSVSRSLPIAAGVLLAAVMVWVQFMAPLGKYSIFGNLFLGIGFYFCYAWHERIEAAEKTRQAEQDAKG